MKYGISWDKWINLRIVIWWGTWAWSVFPRTHQAWFVHMTWDMNKSYPPDWGTSNLTFIGLVTPDEYPSLKNTQP